MNPLWKVYKSKVMKTLNPDGEDESTEEVCETAEEMTPVEQDEGPSTVSQLAKRVQGVGTKGWKSVTALFNKDDEHQLLESEPDSQPVPDHPLAIKPEELTRPNKRTTGFWDAFATKWNQSAAMNQAESAGSAHEGGSNERGQEDQGKSENTVGEDRAGQGNSFSKYASLGGVNDDTHAFKWNFVTNKIAELKSRSAAKSN